MHGRALSAVSTTTEVSTQLVCGICGEIRFDGAQPSALAQTRMMDALAPRGPDGSGLVIYGNTALGHRRLRIIDLSEKARQPMVDAELGLSIAFNGCIYNYPELRAVLELMGYGFFAHVATAVILKAWHAWGKECVNRFHGMFAFVLHERDSGRVVMARDRFGIKPLYLSETPHSVRFASS